MITCPDCGKLARVVETRTPAVRRVARRYVCKSGHAFATTEVLSSDMVEMVAAVKFLNKVKEMAHART